MLTPGIRSSKCVAGSFPSLAFLPVTFLLVASLNSGGCTTVESQSFRVSKAGNVESAYIATDADFGKYDRLLADEMGIFFPQGSHATAEDLQRIRQTFRDAFRSETEGYLFVREPGPSTMEVQATLIDLRGSTSAEIPDMQRAVRDLATPGSLVFLMELRDSSSDRVLARAGDSAAAPTFASSEEAATDWESVETAARHWAELFRQFLDQNLAR